METLQMCTMRWHHFMTIGGSIFVSKVARCESNWLGWGVGNDENWWKFLFWGASLPHRRRLKPQDLSSERQRRGQTASMRPAGSSGVKCSSARNTNKHACAHAETLGGGGRIPVTNNPQEHIQTWAAKLFSRTCRTGRRVFLLHHQQ